MQIFQFMGKIFYVESEREPLKFHTKFIERYDFDTTLKI